MARSRFQAVHEILEREYPYAFHKKDIRRVLEQLPVERNPAQRREQERLIASIVAHPYHLPK